MLFILICDANTNSQVVQREDYLKIMNRETAVLMTKADLLTSSIFIITGYITTFYYSHILTSNN